MAGLSAELRCEGFVEADEFERSKCELKERTGLTDRQIDDRLQGLVWALLREPSAVAQKVGTRNLWAAETPIGVPVLAVYLRPRAGSMTECEWVWIEVRI